MESLEVYVVLANMKLKFIYKKIKTYWNNHPFIASMIVFIFIVAFFSSIYLTSQGDPMPGDRYFHFKYATLLRTDPVESIKNFYWISPGGEIGEGHRYAVSLFQASLIPFTFISDKLFAMTVATIFYASITLAIIYFVMRKMQLRYPLFFTVTLLTMGYFLLRILIMRAYVLIIGLVFVELWLAVEKRYKLLFVASLLHILWHQNTYFLPIIVVGSVEVSRYLVEYKMCWRNILSTLLGTIVGMAFFPGFPKTLINSLLNVMKIQSTDVAEVGAQSIAGTELQSRDFMTNFVNQEIFLFIIVISTAVIIYLYVLHKKNKLNLSEKLLKKQVVMSYSLFIFMIGMFLGTIALSGRFFDFLFPTFFVLTSALFTVIIKLKKVHVDNLLATFLKSGTVIVVLILILNATIIVYAKTNSFDYAPAQKAAQWVQQNSTQPERVFLTNWSVFTLMFFENSYNVYTTGIEPMALKNYDEELYWKYYNIFAHGYYCDEMKDCKEEVEQKTEELKEKGEEFRKEAEKENGRKIIESIKNDFDSKFIIAASNKIKTALSLNPDLIEKQATFKSDRYKGLFMEYTVFELK